MNALKDMKIGSKLVAAFTVVLALLGGLGYYAVSQLAVVNNSTIDIASNWLPSVRTVLELKSNLNRVRVLEYRVIVSSPSEHGPWMKLLDEKLEELRKGQITYGALITSPEETALYEGTYKPNFETFVSENSRVLSLASQNKPTEALAAMEGDSVKSYNALREALDKLSRVNVEGGKVAAAAAAHTYATSRSTVIGVALVSIVLGMLLALSITRSITGPLKLATEVADRLAEGDLTVTMPAAAKDEVGQVLQSMQNMITRLSAVVTEVNGGAEALASASEELSATAQALSQSSNEQAASVEQTSASVEQMTSSIAQNTENAKVTDGIATKAAQEAGEGGEAVKATVAAMNQIAKKIGIIDDIAYQTNLLALNAAIEAARAGEHGKGFAVVAAEVRKLAERSQIAAQEIGEVASSSVELAGKAGKLLGEMVPNIRRTSDLVQEITAASEEQSTGVAQINSAVSQMNQTTQQNSAASEELAATAAEVSGQAEQLQQAMRFFKIHTASAGVTVKAPPRRVAAPQAGTAMRGPRPKLTVSHALANGAAPDEAHFGKF